MLIIQNDLIKKALDHFYWYKIKFYIFFLIAKRKKNKESLLLFMYLGI